MNDPFVEIDLNKQVSADNVQWFKFAGVPVGGPVFYRFSIYNGGQAPSPPSRRRPDSRWRAVGPCHL